MGFVVEVVAYVVGAALIAAGIYLVLRRDFPGWWQGRLLWPLVRVSPTISYLQGWAAVGLGLSILAITLTAVAPGAIAGLLALLGIAAYVLSLLLYLFSTWLSRRGGRIGSS